MKRRYPSIQWKRQTGRAVLILFALVMLYPVFWNLYSSFKSSAEFLGNPFALPSRLEWNNYVRAFEKSNISSNFLNTLIIESVALSVMAVLVIPSSYCLSRFHFWGSRLMQNTYMSLIFIQAPCIMIPLFLQMNTLGWLNKLGPLGLLYAVLQVPFSVFLLSGFMRSIPREYEEAAMIDGCGYYRIMRRIIIPMAKPGIVTVMMLAAMGFWNEYVVALVMLSDPAKQTLSVGVAALYEVQRYATDWGALFAALVIVLLPTALIYAIGQKYLVEGINVGGLKG